MRDLESSNEELTFRPKVTLLPKPRKQLQDYLSTNPYERLSKLSKPKSKARTAVHSSLKDPITSALNEFLARQAEHEFSKEVRRQLDLSHSQRAKSSFKALGSAKATASRIERQSAEGEFADRAERQAKERESDEVTSPSVGQRNEEKGSRETKIRLSKKLGGFMETVKTVGGSNTNAL
eukprot:TRINITY_DN7318_c0_g4_i1.p1 TRINITY_DN7318_c0_g4~~TRINITY_DN7318_c0_g4_i1.p1  ORF type:complete len:179 (-),score=47.42 TRINITY_DN7318_c0_g4_i1:91-627(-)